MKGQDVTGHSAEIIESAMDLFASGPGGLSLRVLASWAAGIFLQFVGAVQVGGVRGGVQFRSNAEAVDRRLGIDEIAEHILVEVSAGEDGYVAKLRLVEDRAHLSASLPRSPLSIRTPLILMPRSFQAAAR